MAHFKLYTGRFFNLTGKICYWFTAVTTTGRVISTSRTYSTKSKCRAGIYAFVRTIQLASRTKVNTSDILIMESTVDY